MDMDRTHANFVGIAEPRRPAVEKVGEQSLEASGTALAGMGDRVKPAFFSFARAQQIRYPLKELIEVHLSKEDMAN